MSNLFVAVVGAPRTGTSLVCDLVKECGFNFGEDAYYTDVIRVGRNEHPLTRTLTEVTEEHALQVVGFFNNQGINASKLHTLYMLDWLKVFNALYSLKVVIIKRDGKNSLMSFKEISPQGDLNDYTKVLNVLNSIIEEDNGYEKFILNFEDLLLKKTEPLYKLRSFLGSDVSIEELKDIIIPEAVVYK